MTSVTDPAGFPQDGNTGHRGSRAVSVAAVPVTVASYEPAWDPGRMTTRRLGHRLFTATETGPRRCTRGLREIARGTGQAEGFFVVAVMGATGAATLVTEQASRRTPAAQDSRHTRIREVHAYVDRHLEDPQLGPRTIAAAHRISVRSLHKLFEGEGATVGRLIQRRRLRAAAENLTRTGSGDRTVSGAARRWGFTDPARFSRLFRASYGISASQWRDIRGARGAGEPSGPRDARGPVSR
ncbi:helix-turn-helix domain-containing protein [Kitasatospora sp. NPDC057965]|uniref:helix-turn-helix domain-containing protein n=1 Tax=Kitasatospora sp. NPDC057965 TaxID=3346291 RepID=UPI0036D9E187